MTGVQTCALPICLLLAPDLNMHSSHPLEMTQITDTIHEECVVAVGGGRTRPEPRVPGWVTTGPRLGHHRPPVGFAGDVALVLP